MTPRLPRRCSPPAAAALDALGEGLKAAAAAARAAGCTSGSAAIVAVARTLAALASLLRSPSQGDAREAGRLPPGLEAPVLGLIDVATVSNCSSASDVAVRSGALKERRAGRRGGRRRHRSGDCDGTPDETGTSTSCGTSVGSKEVDPRGPGEGRDTGRGTGWQGTWRRWRGPARGQALHRPVRLRDSRAARTISDPRGSRHRRHHADSALDCGGWRID